jgi:hypothetical protein
MYNAEIIFCFKLQFTSLLRNFANTESCAFRDKRELCHREKSFYELRNTEESAI